MGARIGHGGAGVLAGFASKPTLVADTNPAAMRLNPFGETAYAAWVQAGKDPQALIAGLQSPRSGAVFGAVRDWVNEQSQAAFPRVSAHAGEAVLAFMDSGALFVGQRAAFGTVRVLEDMLAATTIRAEVAEAALAAFVAGTREFVGGATDMAELVANLGPWLRAVQGGTYVPKALPHEAGQAAEGLDAAGAVMAAALVALREVLASQPTNAEGTVIDAAPVVESGGALVATADAQVAVDASGVTEATSSQPVSQDWIDAAIAKYGEAEHFPKFQFIPAEIRRLLIAQSAGKPAAGEQAFSNRARQKLSDFERKTLRGLTDRVTEKFSNLTDGESEVVWVVLYGRIVVYLRGEMANPSKPGQRLAPRVSDMRRQFARWIGLAAGALQHFRARQAVALPAPSGAASDDASEAVVVEPAVTPPSEAAMAGGGGGGQEDQPAPELAASADEAVVPITRKARIDMQTRVRAILLRIATLRSQIDGGGDEATALRKQLDGVVEDVQSHRALISYAVGEIWTGIVDAATKAEDELSAAEELVPAGGALSHGTEKSKQPNRRERTRGQRALNAAFEARSR